jgi:hypothetical protein
MREGFGFQNAWRKARMVRPKRRRRTDMFRCIRFWPPICAHGKNKAPTRRTGTSCSLLVSASTDRTQIFMRNNRSARRRFGKPLPRLNREVGPSQKPELQRSRKPLMFRRLGYFRMPCRSLENRFAHLSCRPPHASCRSLCSTAIALLLVILVRSLRHQGWRDLRWLDRGALLHGGGTFPFDRQWGRSYFHAISQEPLLRKAPAGAPPYLRMTRIGLLVSDSV